MFLEEALAGSASPRNNGNPNNVGNISGSASVNNPYRNSKSSSTVLLAPSDAALALLSFLQDELPAGGIAAEKRFVNLFPLICEKAFGPLIYPPPSSPSQSSSTSPSSTISSSFSSPSSHSPGPSSPSLSGKGIYHEDGGWLSLRESPSVLNYNQQSRTPTQPSQKSPSLENDPIARLLRAPRLVDTRRGVYNAPTLLDAIGAESVHRPNIKFKFPLEGLPAATRGDWKECFLYDLKSAAAAMGGGVSGKGSGSPWTSSRGVSRAFGNTGIPASSVGGYDGESDEAVVGAPKPGIAGKENATRLLLRVFCAGPADQTELRSYYQQLLQHQQSPHHLHSPFSKSHAFGGSSPLLHYSATPTRTSTSSPVTGMSSPMPTQRSGMNGGSATNASANTDEPQIQLTMLEYYLLLFLRFPLANPSALDIARPQQPQQRPSARFRNRNAGLTYGQRVYSYLFSTYLSYYLPHGAGVPEYSEGGSAARSNGSGPNPIFATTSSKNGTSQPSSEVGITCFDRSSTLGRTSELFLRLVIELWIEGHYLAPTTSESVARFCHVRRTAGGMGLGGIHVLSSAPAKPSLRDALELAQPLRHPYNPPPHQAQWGILALVRHLVSDRSLRIAVRQASIGCQNQQNREQIADTSESTSDFGAHTDGDPVSPTNQAGTVQTQDEIVRIPWCLPPAVTAVQPSLFNFIRSSLACGAIHAPDSVFHRALETWLIWLEPWNFIVKKRTGSNFLGTSSIGNQNKNELGTNGTNSSSATQRAGQFLRNAAATVAAEITSSTSQRSEYSTTYVKPKPTSRSNYSPEWEAYVLTNAHFYTVPLAIFLKRARELDFFNLNEYHKSLSLLQRVLRVFCKPLVSVLNSALNKQANFVTMTLLARHEENLGEYCPPNDWSLQSCQPNAINLLEDIFAKHRRRVQNMDFFERYEAKLEAFFSPNRLGSEEAAIQNLLSRFRCLVNLPRNYKVLPDEPQTTNKFRIWRLLGFGEEGAGALAPDTDGGSVFAEKGADGRLTDRGRQQIYSGMRKCDPMDIRYIGDPMLARATTYEIPILVELTIRVSMFLNRKLGLMGPDIMPGGDNDSGNSFDSPQMKLLREMERYQNVRFRVNLRFLADSRSIIFVSIIVSLVRVIGALFQE